MGETVFRKCLRVNSKEPSGRLEDFIFSSDELKFYFKLHTHQYWTTAKVVEETGVARVTVYRYFKKMGAAGLLEVDDKLGKKQKRRLRWRRKFNEVRVMPWGVIWVKPYGRR